MKIRYKIVRAYLRCLECGRIEKIWRKETKKHSVGHLKDLWCPRCQRVTKFTQLSYDMEFKPDLVGVDEWQEVTGEGMARMTDLEYIRARVQYLTGRGYVSSVGVEVRQDEIGEVMEHFVSRGLKWAEKNRYTAADVLLDDYVRWKQAVAEAEREKEEVKQVEEKSIEGDGQDVKSEV